MLLFRPCSCSQAGAPLAASTPSSLSGTKLRALIVGIAVGGLLLLIGVGICFFYYRRRRMITETELPTTTDNRLSGSNFTYRYLATATDNFSSARLLGRGGFGCVHKGVLPTGDAVAVKQLKVGSTQGDREFGAEVEAIRRVHHRHLVSVLGYSVHGKERLLVYEFVSNGTVELHLHGSGKPPLSWEARLNIAVGAAKGLTHLHEVCRPKIIHRDVKASNILLDASFNAKLLGSRVCLNRETYGEVRCLFIRCSAA